MDKNTAYTFPDKKTQNNKGECFVYINKVL